MTKQQHKQGNKFLINQLQRLIAQLTAAFLVIINTFCLNNPDQLCSPIMTSTIPWY